MVRSILRGIAFALICAPALPGCEAGGDAWRGAVATTKAGTRLAERCSPGMQEERSLPLTDAKITSTLRTIEAIVASKARPSPPPEGQEEEPMVTALEAGGLGCGQQTAVLGKVMTAIDRLRERRGLPPLGKTEHAVSDDSETAKALTDADIALVDARFDEVNRATERLAATGK